MRTSRTSLCFLVAAILGGCGGSSGPSGGGSSARSTAAPTTSATSPSSLLPGSSSPSSNNQSGPLDYSGVWEIAGTDAARGAYSGTATVTASVSSAGYAIQRLVTYQTATASGQSVASAWNATGSIVPAGLHLQATLRRANVVQRLGTQTRTAADRSPLVVDAILAPPGGGTVTGVGNGFLIQASFAGPTPTSGLTETWVRSGTGAPLFPATDVNDVLLHAPPTPGEHALLFGLFATFRTLPYVAPYVPRPDFQGGVHSIPVDHTARDYYRAQGPASVVVVDGIVDDISVQEETWRADAFGRSLHEKAAGFDSDMETNHVDATGMTADLIGPAPYQRQVSGDGALHLGCWVASQVYRYQATQDPQALQNVQLGLKALLTCVDITPDKTQFARAIQATASAPTGWTQGTGVYANLAWLPGGNNDMLHGIEYGFLAAEQVLAAGDPLRAEIGKQALSLVDNVSIAQSGTHEIILLSAAWRTTNDPAVQARYKSALQGNLKDRLWTGLGNGIFNFQGIMDGSGHHLGEVTFCALRILGGANPDSDEQGWRNVTSQGAKDAFADQGPAREGLLAAVAGAVGVSGAGDQTKDILAEIPFPKPTGDADIERDITDAYCISPYPSDPWKLDWMTNQGRVDALTGLPIFYRGGDDNYWARGCLPTGGSVTAEIPMSQDYLHVYWLGRVAGTISPND